MRSHQQSTMRKNTFSWSRAWSGAQYTFEQWQYESKFRFVNNGGQWCYWCRKCWWVYSVNVAVKFPFQLLGCLMCLLTPDKQSTCNAQTAMLSLMVQTITNEPGSLALLTRPQSSRPRQRQWPEKARPRPKPKNLLLKPRPRLNVTSTCLHLYVYIIFYCWRDCVLNNPHLSHCE